MDKTKVTKWIGILNSPSYSKRDVLAAILEECTYDELESIYKRSPNLLKGLLSLSYLKRTSYNQLFTSNVKPRRDLKEYIGVVAYVVKRNAPLITKYIEYRTQVERAILTGQYEQARQLIETINTTISYSYWAATCLIKIARLEKGLNECTDLNEDLLDSIEKGFKYSKGKPNTRLQVHLGPVASVPAVLSSKEQVENIQKHVRKLLGVEMEGYGVFYAASNCVHPRPKYKVLIKSVSDYADPEKSDDYKSDDYQEYAMYTSAEFAKYIILNEL